MRATLCVVLSLCACNDKGSDSNGGSDGDDSGSGGTPVDLDADGYSPPDDCDDNDAEIHPDASEVCDGADNDCDGTTDVGATDAVEYWADGDGDGYGAGTSELSCSPVDGRSARRPGALSNHAVWVPLAGPASASVSLRSLRRRAFSRFKLSSSACRSIRRSRKRYAAAGARFPWMPC